METLKRIIQESRIKGIALSKLCKMAGVSPSVFTRWKNGTGIPNLATVEKIQRALEEYKEEI